MGNFFSKTKNIENIIVSKIIILNNGQFVLLSESEIEIISQDNLETDITIKGEHFLNLFQISNGNIIIFSKSKIQMISLKNNNEYDTIQEMLNENDIFYAKLFETNEEIIFLRQNFKNNNNNILIDIYNNTNSTIEKNTKNNNYSEEINKLIDAELLIQKNIFIIFLVSKLKFIDKKTYNLKHEITNNDFYLQYPRINAICILDDNYVLIGTHKNLYILNINNYEFVSIIRHDTMIKGITNIKKDINGNIILTANNYLNCKGFFSPKDYLIVYKFYNNNEPRLEKIYNETFSDRVRDFVFLNENKISFLLEYFPFFGDNQKQYLKISNYSF